MTDLQPDAYSAGTSPQLARSLRRRHITMIALGGIIGAGLFVGSSAGIAAAGPAIILSYLLAAMVMILLMRMLAEMAVAFPGAGGFTEYARIGLGNWAGFVSGWLYWFFWVVVIAVEAIAAAAIVGPMLGIPSWLTGLALILAMTATNLRSTRSYGEFEFWFASIKVVAIVAFIATCAVYLIGFRPEDTGAFSNLTSYGGFAPFGPATVFAGITSAVFALVGTEIATVAAVEADEPDRAVAQLGSTLVMRVTLFYVGSLFAILCVVPWKLIIPGKSPFVAALDIIGIPAAAPLMTFLVLTAVLSAMNSAIYVSSRTLFVLAAHGDAPQALVTLNTRRVPARAIVVGTLFGYLSVIASVISPQVVFAFLVNASGAVMLFVYALMAGAQIRTRRSLECTAPDRLRLRMWCFPWFSHLAIIAMMAVLAAMAFIEGMASQLYMSLVSLGMALGAYYLRSRKRAPFTPAPLKNESPS